MHKEEKANSITGGLFWKFAERICAQGVSFIVSMVLARILMPDDYGVVAILLIFINIANVFVSQGFSSALIQKKNAERIDFSTMCFCSIACSILLYLILFWAAIPLAAFYDNDLLIPTLRVLSVKLLITSVNSIQHAYVSRHMIFKKFFFSTIIGTIISSNAHSINSDLSGSFCSARRFNRLSIAPRERSAGWRPRSDPHG